MSKYIQADRPIHIKSPLGTDDLLVTAVRGREAMSELFHFDIEVVAELATPVEFQRLLGEKVTIRIETIPESENYRYISGIVKKVAQAERTEEFKKYHIELVPQFWMLTRKIQSRIFQHLSVPDILKKVLTGLDVSYEIQGTFHEREYVVQYQESDFDFACRLMEEEGIYYFFKHRDGGHTMLLADTPESYADVPFNETVFYEEFFGHSPKDDRVMCWYKAQEIRTGKVTLRDEHFQLPNQHLEAQKPITPSLQTGTETLELTAGGASALERYEFPGEYSRHFDGIDKGGGEQPSELNWIFQENERTAEVRMQQEAVGAVVIEAESAHAGLTPGHKFTLQKHFSDDGSYLLLTVEHESTQSIGVQGAEEVFTYKNRIACIPSAQVYRPPRITPIPSVRGVQTALVVGPQGEEIFTDKYGRIKVQFRWDREGQNNIDSSCWLRVATFWAGKNWGAIHIPRIGQEVLVAFEEGDVDHPIVVGSLYNADMMPPYDLPPNRSQSGIKSRSTLHGGPANYNEIRFEDKKGEEEFLAHAEKDLKTEVEHDETRWVGHDRTTTIDNDDTLHVKNNLTENIDNKQRTEAKTSIEIIVGQSSIKIEPAQITIKTVKLTVETTAQTAMKSAMTNIESSGITTIKGAMVKIN